MDSGDLNKVSLEAFRPPKTQTRTTKRKINPTHHENRDKTPVRNIECGSPGPDRLGQGPNSRARDLGLVAAQHIQPLVDSVHSIIYMNSDDECRQPTYSMNTTTSQT